jgi:hypothetical protein
MAFTIRNSQTTSTENPLISLYTINNFDPSPSSADLIVLFCQKYKPDVLEQNLGKHYAKKFEVLQPTDKLQVLSRISNDRFVSFFFGKLPPEMRKRYIEIASTIAPSYVVLNPTQLRLDAIAQYRDELART